MRIHHFLQSAAAGVFALLAALPTTNAADPLSEQELAEKLKLYASISTLEASFKQVKTLKDMGIELKSEGRLKLVRPSKVIWEVTQPSPVSVVLDRNEIKIHSGQGPDARDQVLKLSDAPSSGGAQEGAGAQGTKSLTGLIAWLNLDSHVLFSQYRVYAESKGSFRFEPKDKSSSAFQDLLMSLNSDGQLNRLTIHEVSGDSLEINFGKPKIKRQ